MKRNRIILIFSLLLLFNPVYSQQPEAPLQVKKSTDKVRIEGKYYYIHIARKSETLYLISKTYGVSQMEIAIENPDIYLGIKVDQAIKIPANDIPTKGEESDRYIYHIVKKGETLFGLSKRYQVPIDDIVKVNPDVQSGLILSQVLLIPREKVNTINQGIQKDSGMFIYHQVRPKEGLYSIAKLYDINIQTLENLNKDVLSNGLKFGSILKIPQKGMDSALITTAQQDGLYSSQPAIKNEVYSVPPIKCDTFNYRSSKRVFNVSLLLPLLPEKEEKDSTERIATESDVNSAEKSNESERISSKAHNFLDFYQGFLLAVDSLKREGVSLNLSVYNTSKTTNESRKLLTEKGVKESDLIVGPVYPEFLQPFADFARENRISIVSPLSQNDALLRGNPYYFQVNPSPLIQFDEFASKVNFCSDMNLIVVYEDDSSNLELSNKYKNLVKNRINQCENAESIHFKELVYKPGGFTTEIKDKLNQSMTDQKENVFIVPSENEAFVSDFLSQLFALTTYYNYQVKVYGFPRWQRFKNIPVDYYYRLNLHLFTPYYVNYNRKDVKNFVDDYRHYYRAEASQYSFQGYDIGLYFLKALQKYGVDFKYCLSNLKVDLLQSDYRFVQQSSVDGFDNKSVFLIRYTQDFDIVEVK